MKGDTTINAAIARDLQHIFVGRGELVLWVVTKNPSDYPGKFVARPGMTGGMSKNVLVCDTLDELREALPWGLHRIERHSADDPVVLEVWI